MEHWRKPWKWRSINFKWREKTKTRGYNFFFNSGVSALLGKPLLTYDYELLLYFSLLLCILRAPSWEPQSFSFFHLSAPVASRGMRAASSSLQLRCKPIHFLKIVLKYHLYWEKWPYYTDFLGSMIRYTLCFSPPLHRYRVVFQVDTGIFTFVVTRSVTRDLHRDVTSKEFA